MASQTAIRRYVRFAIADRTAYGLWRDGTIEELKGSIFEEASRSGESFRAEEVRLLVRCEPSKVIAVGLNCASDQIFVTSAKGALLPGDVIFTGTPGKTQAVTHGDRIEIEGVGRLRNSVAVR
jgi:hypothetical protein